MTAEGKEESKCSEKNKEKEDGLKTVECLRGRLLTERQTSRAANEDAKQLSNKLVELENLIKEETKLRDRAEKKLKCLTKKVKSLKIPQDLEHQSSSCRSTISSSSGSTTEKDQKEPQMYGSVLTRQDKIDETLVDHNAVDTISNQSQDSSLDQNSSFPVGGNFGRSTSSLSLKGSKRMEMEMSEGDDDCADNALALVPISPPVTSDDKPKMVNINANVSEVLDNLRQLREKLQSSLEKRRPMIEVGPT